jgi:hypothetical protein
MIMKGLLTFFCLLLTFLAPGQERWQYVGGNTNPVINSKFRTKLDADSGVYSKGVRVLTEQDTFGGAWLSTKPYVDSLFQLHDGAWLSVTGDTVKTHTVYKSNGDAWLSADVRDNDNQTLSLSSDDTLSITGGNKVWMPYERINKRLFFSSTGSTSKTFALPGIISGTPIQLFYNGALVDSSDYNLSGSAVTVSFDVETSDYIGIYYNLSRQQYQTITGISGTTVSLSFHADNSYPIQVFYNTAWVSPEDYTVDSGDINFDFPIEPTDHVSIYFTKL